MKLKLSQIALVVAITEEVTKQAKDQGMKDFPAEAFQVNAIIDGANLICKGFAREKVESKNNMGLVAWLASDDTGTSSRAMAHHLCGVPEDHRWGSKQHPLDPSDFGRCHRFLEAVPGTRARLGQMVPVSPVWARLVEHWDELTALYLEELPSGKAPKTYARMKELGC